MVPDASAGCSHLGCPNFGVRFPALDDPGVCVRCGAPFPALRAGELRETP